MLNYATTTKTGLNSESAFRVTSGNRRYVTKRADNIDDRLPMSTDKNLSTTDVTGLRPLQPPTKQLNLQSRLRDSA